MESIDRRQLRTAFSTNSYSRFAPLRRPRFNSPTPKSSRASIRYWQTRVLISSIIGYATFYFVRKNLSIAMPFMETGLGIQKSQLGLFLTLHGLLYGVSKFANGFFGRSRAHARNLMVTGLAASAILNVAFGFSSTVFVLGSNLDAERLVSGNGLFRLVRV
jgi:sugar phosphate permease